eukprot:symbB.v1.2.022972.t1/scaffold2048.1/size91153/5
MSSLSLPLLRTEDTNDDINEADVIQHWASKLEGCAPLLSQLPTDQLGPAEQHREADVVSVTFAMKGAWEQVDAPHAAAHLVCGLATLMGRYSLATELSVGLWRSDLGSRSGCQPLRVSLVRQANDPTPLLPTQTEEETLWSQG